MVIINIWLEKACSYTSLQILLKIIHPECPLTGHEGEIAQVSIWRGKEINNLNPADYHLSIKYELLVILDRTWISVYDTSKSVFGIRILAL